MNLLTVADTTITAAVYPAGHEFTCELADTEAAAEFMDLVAVGERAVVTHQGEDWNGVVTHVTNEPGEREVVVNAERRNWW